MESVGLLFQKFSYAKKTYKDKYAPEAWQFIEENFFKYLSKTEVPDILMELYSELGLQVPAAKFYQRHFDLMQKYFPIDGNILEIGSGMIPAFANLVAKKQCQIQKGTITIYEPLLIDMTPKYPNMALHKEYFASDANVSDIDLVVGIMPCEATETILRTAIKNGKDFYVAMCGCVHSTSPFGLYYPILPSMYQDEIIRGTQDLLERYNGGELVIDHFENHAFSYPILHNKRH